MLRLIGFFAAVWVVHRLLLFVPGIGPVLAKSSFFGFWLVAILVAVLSSGVLQRRLAIRRLARRRSELLAAGTPHNHGKVGLIDLSMGRAKRAKEHLELAFEGQPDVLDWALGLGNVHLALDEPQRAGEYFARVVQGDPDMGFGAPWLGLAQAAIGVGRPADALEPLEECERRFGKTPELMLVRGLALKQLGRKEEAQQALDQVGELARDLPGAQRGRKLKLGWRAFWQKLK